MLKQNSHPFYLLILINNSKIPLIKSFMLLGIRNAQMKKMKAFNYVRNKNVSEFSFTIKVSNYSFVGHFPLSLGHQRFSIRN